MHSSPSHSHSQSRAQGLDRVAQTYLGQCDAVQLGVLEVEPLEQAEPTTYTYSYVISMHTRRLRQTTQVAQHIPQQPEDGGNTSTPLLPWAWARLVLCRDPEPACLRTPTSTPEGTTR